MEKLTEGWTGAIRWMVKIKGWDGWIDGCMEIRIMEQVHEMMGLDP